LYLIAFLQDDAAGMAQQVAWSIPKTEMGGELWGVEAETAAYSGRLTAAREFSRRATDSAQRARQEGRAAAYAAQSGLREALLGNAEQARRSAARALEGSTAQGVQYAAALALAYAGDEARARAQADDMGRRFPEDTLVRFNYLPSLRAKLALSNGNSSQAIEYLRAAAPYELGRVPAGSYGWLSLYPVFVRGDAYLAGHQGREAAAEFEKILNHRGIVVNGPIGALAHLGLGRAYAMQADTARAKIAYQDFLTLWKDADPDIPILKQAKAEYAKLY
jgi:tetratricopeptide (TPR) repeat protein